MNPGHGHTSAAPAPGCSLQVKKLLYAGWILPHYRWGVYESLSQLSTLSTSFAGGDDSTLGVPQIPLDLLRQGTVLKNCKFGPARMQIGLGRAIRKNDPDILILEGDARIVSSWLWALWARIRGIDVYFWTIGWHRPEHGLKSRARLAFYRLANGLLLYGDVGRQFGEIAGADPARLHVIGNSSSSHLELDASTNASVLNLPNWEDTDIVLGAVIGLKAVKKLEQIIEAAAVLRSRGRDAKVLIVGSGPEESRLRNLADRLAVALSLPGSAYGANDLERVYRLLDVCVIPSTAGLSTLQSLKHGVPVITHDDWAQQAPEAESIRPGINGGFFPCDDIDALADQVECWADLSRSGKQIRELCRATTSGPWSPHAHARRIENVLLRGAILEPDRLPAINIPSSTFGASG